MGRQRGRQSGSRARFGRGRRAQRGRRHARQRAVGQQAARVECGGLGCVQRSGAERVGDVGPARGVAAHESRKRGRCGDGARAGSAPPHHDAAGDASRAGPVGHGAAHGTRAARDDEDGRGGGGWGRGVAARKARRAHDDGGNHRLRPCPLIHARLHGHGLRQGTQSVLGGQRVRQGGGSRRDTAALLQRGDRLAAGVQGGVVEKTRAGRPAATGPATRHSTVAAVTGAPPPRAARPSARRPPGRPRCARPATAPQTTPSRRRRRCGRRWRAASSWRRGGRHAARPPPPRHTPRTRRPRPARAAASPRRPARLPCAWRHPGRWGQARAVGAARGQRGGRRGR